MYNVWSKTLVQISRQFLLTINYQDLEEDLLWIASREEVEDEETLNPDLGISINGSGKLNYSGPDGSEKLNDTGLGSIAPNYPKLDRVSSWTKFFVLLYSFELYIYTPQY